MCREGCCGGLPLGGGRILSAVLTLRWQGRLSEARVTQGPADLTLSAITPLALPSRRLTHWWSCQRLSTHNLGWSQPIQEVAELAFGPEPGGGEDEPGKEAEGHVRASGWWDAAALPPRHGALPSCLSFPSP